MISLPTGSQTTAPKPSARPRKRLGISEGYWAVAVIWRGKYHLFRFPDREAAENEFMDFKLEPHTKEVALTWVDNSGELPVHTAIERWKRDKRTS